MSAYDIKNLKASIPIGILAALLMVTGGMHASAAAEPDVFNASPRAKPRPTLVVVPFYVEICPGIQADRNGLVGASAAIQHCLDKTASPWTIPPGTYKLDTALTFHRGISIQGDGVAWVADLNVRGYDAHWGHGLIYAGYLPDPVEIHGLRIDGNGYSRRGAGRVPFCDGTGAASYGANLVLDNVPDVILDRVVTTNAPCGSGMVIIGTRARITNSHFTYNGTQEGGVKNMWSDGLTLLECWNCVVEGNTFVNNSDVAFVFGGGQGTRVAGNQIIQTTPAFAGFMLDNFNDSRSGDFRGTVVEDNWIDCGALQCSFGISMGPHTWYLSKNTVGGVVRGNTVHGAKIGMIAQGAGTKEFPVVVYANDVSSLVPDGTEVEFSCGARTTFTRAANPNSFLDTGGYASWSPAVHVLCP